MPTVRNGSNPVLGTVALALEKIFKAIRTAD
jgi:hypothetical protein